MKEQEPLSWYPLGKIAKKQVLHLGKEHLLFITHLILRIVANLVTIFK